MVSGMIRKILLIIGVLVLLIVVPSGYQLGISLGVWPPLTRPPGVSRSARYVSFFEMPAWFDCSVNASRNTNTCKAWNRRGRLLADGEFQVENENRAAIASELRPVMVGCDKKDGKLVKVIYLGGQMGISGKRLIAVDNQKCE